MAVCSSHRRSRSSPPCFGSQIPKISSDTKSVEEIISKQPSRAKCRRKNVELVEHDTWPMQPQGKHPFRPLEKRLELRLHYIEQSMWKDSYRKSSLKPNLEVLEPGVVCPVSRKKHSSMQLASLRKISISPSWCISTYNHLESFLQPSATSSVTRTFRFAVF